MEEAEEIIAKCKIIEDIDSVIAELLNTPPNSRERALSITKLEESRMWLEADLRRIRESNKTE